MTIDQPSDTQALRCLWKQAFGDSDAFLDSFFSVGYSCDRCRQLSLDSQLAAALYWFDCSFSGKPVAYVYAVATDAAFQGQGLCRALMADTHRHLQKLGYVGAILVPGAPSLFKFYEKLGYRTCSHMDRFTCQAGTPVPLRPVDAAEYAALRRRFLPPDSVVQEGPLLAFLQTQTAFFAGPDFVCCASLDGDVLTVPEFLGNPASAPGFTAALQARQGHFRTPGKTFPFAMYYPLSNELEAPGYLGLALD